MPRKRKTDQQELVETPEVETEQPDQQELVVTPVIEETSKTEPAVGTENPELGVYLGNGMWVKRN